MVSWYYGKSKVFDVRKFCLSPCTVHHGEIKLLEPSRVMAYVPLPPKCSTGERGSAACTILNYGLKNRRGVKGEQF